MIRKTIKIPLIVTFVKDIPAELIQDTKTMLKKYLKVKNNIVLRDRKVQRCCSSAL